MYLDKEKGFHRQHNLRTWLVLFHFTFCLTCLEGRNTGTKTFLLSLVFQEFHTVQTLVGMSGTFWIFGAFCLLGLLFVIKLVPETKGKSLEDIELYFLGRAIRGI